MSSFYGYKIIGFFEDSSDVAKSPVQDAAAPGRFKYLDANGDDTINDKDRVYYGNANPDFTAGINVGISFKGFDLSAFFYGSFGNEVINVQRFGTDFFPGVTAQPFGRGPKSKTLLYDSWTPEHHNAKTAIVENDFNFSNYGTVNSYAMEDGSYFRNKSLMLGYTFPGSRLQKIKMQNLRVYLQAVNLFTITKYTGLDPEIGGHSDGWGADFGNYPAQKQYLIGLNVSF